MTTSLFRVSPARSASGHLWRTFGQCAVVWGATLVVGPWIVLQVERAIGATRFEFPAQLAVSVSLFIAFSTLNLASGTMLAVRGEGTPLPLECPRRLVIAGPYRFIRNPMALAGLGQGAAVGLGLGSWSVLAYVAIGGVVWHTVLRPAEERDLVARFGEAYLTYQRAVPLWWPRATPFRTT
jgi:protein-S-isoprenylcysteine O-methyltransferase Ste14